MGMAMEEFNCNKTEEVIFSVKRSKIEHPTLNLGSDDIKRTDEHKHLGIILDSQLNFKSHIRQAISKARRGCLGMYLIRSTNYMFAHI